ncbi:hypothetical protein GCM10007863_18350 [Dyella mobilis]|nr:hypothetical protein GCM10007863_18350 [Dyella mobilis]
MTATRRSLAKRLTLDDLESRDEVLDKDTIPGFEKAFIETRDNRLISMIEASLARADEPRLVVITYGAAHVRAVTDYLINARGYRVEKSDWVVVMDYDADG